MNKILLITFFFLVKFINAQTTVTVSGFSENNKRSFNVSRTVQRLLFIKLKGHVQLTDFDNGYFLHLTNEDSLKTGFGEIIVVPSGDEVYRKGQEADSLDLVSLSENAPGVFYTRPNDIHKDVSYSRKIFSKPTLKDTVDWGDVTGSRFYYTKEWIANLDNEREVTLKSYIIYETDRGGGTHVQYSKIQMKELAKARLNGISNLFHLDGESWTKKQWQNWYETIINYQEPKPKDYDMQNYIVQNIYNYFEGSISLYGDDPVTNKVFAIKTLPYNVDQFKGRQIVIIDSARYNKYDYYREDQEETHNLRAFESENNKLYFMDFYGNWSSYEYDPGKDQYMFKQKKSINLPPSVNDKAYYTVNHTQTSKDIMYCILHEAKSKKYYVAIVKTQSGETLRIMPLKDLLSQTSLKYTKTIEIIPLNYGLKNNRDLIFGIKQENDYYLVKVGEELADVNLIKAPANISGATLFVNHNRIDVFKSQGSTLLKVSFDRALKNILSNQHVKIKHWYSDENGIVIYDGINYRLFAPYRLPILSGINLLTLNDKLETLKTQCVYQYIPLQDDENSYDYIIDLEYATKQNEDWLVLFRQGSSLRYAKVK